MHRRTFCRIVATAALTSLSAARANAVSHEEEDFPISSSEAKSVPARFRRQSVRYLGKEKPGTIIVDTANKFLYLVRPGGRAIRYGIGVGRQGFSWSGRAHVRWKAKWPRWTPPSEMVARDPLAAKWADGMPGGPTNPLGARALYLFQGDVDTLYRIHGTFDPRSIGKAVSSGCIRLLNVDVADLYERVIPGAQVIVIQGGHRTFAPEEPRPRIKIYRKPEARTEIAPTVRKNFNLNP